MTSTVSASNTSVLRRGICPLPDLRDPAWPVLHRRKRRTFKTCPKKAMAYLRFLADLMEVLIAIVLLGAGRDQTIVVEDPIHGPKRALLPPDQAENRQGVILRTMTQPFLERFLLNNNATLEARDRQRHC